MREEEGLAPSPPTPQGPSRRTHLSGGVPCVGPPPRCPPSPSSSSSELLYPTSAALMAGPAPSGPPLPRCRCRRGPAGGSRRRPPRPAASSSAAAAGPLRSRTPPVRLRHRRPLLSLPLPLPPGCRRHASAGLGRSAQAAAPPAAASGRADRGLPPQVRGPTAAAALCVGLAGAGRHPLPPSTPPPYPTAGPPGGGGGEGLGAPPPRLSAGRRGRRSRPMGRGERRDGPRRGLRRRRLVSELPGRPRAPRPRRAAA